MSNFIGRPPFSNLLWVGIETMQFHIAQTKFFLRTPSFPIQGVPMNNLAPMKNCPGGCKVTLIGCRGIYLAALKKGAIRAAHPYYDQYIKKVTPPPPPPPRGNNRVDTNVTYSWS